MIQDSITETASEIHTCPEINPLSEVSDTLTRPRIIDPAPAPSSEDKDDLPELLNLENNRIPSIAKKVIAIFST